jgi:hypothetical protein
VFLPSLAFVWQWNVPRSRRVDLTQTLAQLGRDFLQIERGKKFVLRAAGDRLARILLRSARDREEAVLRQIFSLRGGVLAQFRIVSGVAGEMMQREGIFAFRHDAQRDGNPGGQQHGRQSRLAADDFRHIGPRHEIVEHCGRIARGGDEIDVPHQLHAAPDAARHADLADGPVAA